MDQLAWDGFVGLSLLLAALTFGGDRFTGLIRAAMLISGSFCLIGTLGPLLGDMRIQRIGIVGYAVMLPAVCLLLTRFFRRRGGSGMH